MADNSSDTSPRSDATMPLPAEIARQGGGERFGRFHLGKRLGAGVSHDLWQAWDPEKQVWLALRVWPRPPAGEKERVHAAGKSARLAADPRILAPVGGGLESGQLWVARPYLEALPVRDLPWQDGRTLARVARECGQALEGAHAKGMAHGRMTAGNILVVSKEEKGRGWQHTVFLTEFGLSEGDAASDVKSLGRVFCELTGQPTPGSGATTKSARDAGGDSTDVAKKGDTTLGSSSGDKVVMDGALVGIFLRARDGQLTAGAMVAELGAWLSRRPAAPPAGRGPKIAAAVVVAVLILVAGFAVTRRGHGRSEAARALAESSRAESEGRLAAALERARFAAAADPSSASAAEAVKRLVAAVQDQNSSLETKRAAEAAAKEADRQLVVARTALAAAEEAARSATPERKLIDKLLAPALEAIQVALRAKAGYPPALRLLEEAATLFEPGDLSRLPRGVDGRPILTPALALRADLAAWAASCYGPRGSATAHGHCSDVSLRLALYPVAGKPVPVDPVPLPDPAAPGRVALSIAEAGTATSSSPAAAAWSAAVRALLNLDPDTALRTARVVQPAPDDPFAPDLAWVIGAADEASSLDYFARALRARPWDPMFLISQWSALRLTSGRGGALAIVENGTALHPTSADLQLARGWSHYTNWDLDKALEDALATADRDPSALILVAEIEYSQGKLEEAVGECTEALRLDNSLALALLVRAMSRHRLRAEKEGLADVEEAVTADPNRYEAIIYRAELRDFAGDRAGAFSDCEKAIKLAPELSGAYRARGWIHFHAGDDEKALQDAEKCIQLGGQGVRALALRAFVKVRHGDPDGAMADASRYLGLDGFDPLAWAARGYAKSVKGDLGGAMEDCIRALRLYPGLPEALRLRALLRSNVEGHADSVIEDATEVLAHDPHDEVMLRTRALARLIRGMLEGALADCDAALAIDPRDVNVLLTRASIRSARAGSTPGSDSSAVLDDLERALSIQPKNVLVLERKAEQLSRLGRNREAADAMTKALDVDPGAADLLTLRASYRDLAGDVAGALADAETLMKSFPKSAAGFYRHSSLLLKKGDLETALLDAIDGTRAEPGNVAIWRLLGDVYVAKGGKDRALEAYGQVVRQSVEGNPDRILAESAIKKLGAR